MSNYVKGYHEILRKMSILCHYYEKDINSMGVGGQRKLEIWRYGNMVIDFSTVFHIIAKGQLSFGVNLCYGKQTSVSSSSGPKEKNHSGQNRAFASNKKEESLILSQSNVLLRQGHPNLLKALRSQ